MLKFMRNKILIPTLIVLCLAAFLSFKLTGSSKRSSQEKRKLAIEVVMAAIQHEHFSPRPVDDTFSSRVFKKTMDAFDAGKTFFTKQDFQVLKRYEFQIDDEIKSGSLEFFDSLDAIYQRRIAQCEKIYEKCLEKPFVFDGNERLELDNKKDDFPDGEAGQVDKWTKILKFRTLEKFIDLKDDQDKKKVDSPKAHFKTEAELELEAREYAKKTEARIFKSIHKWKDNDRFTAYVNQITECQDPHTNYMPPQNKEDFDVAMSGSFFGIGAALKENFDNGKITITSIVTGSPSWKQGDLKPDDEILKVAQGSGVPVEVTGFEINEVVKLIRGPKGTEVKLTVKKPDGTIKVVSLYRDVITLEETFAKSAVIQKSNTKVGYIYLPEFYADFNHTSMRRCCIDVLEEVKKLKAEGVNSIILDLRGNGGGSLNDVVEMASIFVGKNPVVQVKNSNSGVNILRSSMCDTALFNGPMAVMVNEGSASASEIMAAALQDFKRAVIVGAPTFGKGTVQKMLRLDELLNPMTRIQLQSGADSAEPSLGEVKLTMEKFYRVNGGSTQLKGVVPDIILPDALDYIDDEDLGERKNKSALPYDEIAPAPYEPVNKVFDIAKLSQLSKERIAKNEGFALIEETASERKKKMDDRSVSLNEKLYRKEQTETKALNKKIDELNKKITPMTVKNPQADLSKINVDTTTANKNKEWLKNVGKDIYLSETVNILDDMLNMRTNSVNISNKK